MKIVILKGNVSGQVGRSRHKSLFVFDIDCSAHHETYLDQLCCFRRRVQILSLSSNSSAARRYVHLGVQ